MNLEIPTKAEVQQWFTSCRLPDSTDGFKRNDVEPTQPADGLPSPERRGSTRRESNNTRIARIVKTIYRHFAKVLTRHRQATGKRASMQNWRARDAVGRSTLHSGHPAGR